MPLANTDIAELLARRAADAEGHRARAYRSAARTALMWAEEAADLVAAGRPLTELERIGPSLATRVQAWIEEDEPSPAPPPARHDFLSFAAARALLARTPDPPRLRGDLQMHTIYSDGKESVAAMAEGGRSRGYQYVAITDHSKGLPIAGGIDEATLAAQGEEIASVNERLAENGLRVLRSVELNIGPTGEVDLDLEALEGLDLVLASPHSALRSKEDQTERYVGALSHPLVRVIGHPRGRRFDARTGIVADWRRVIEVAAALGKAMEINSYPDRQDLNVELLRLVAEVDGWVAIDTDAHNTSEMRFIDIGVAAALRAGIARNRIVNLLRLPELLEWASS